MKMDGPLACEVTEISGTRTFQVNFTIQTFVYEGSAVYGANVPAQSNPPAILSNRWTMEQHLDEDWMSTRVIRGRAVFRTDVLQRWNYRPDSFRHDLILPVPPNFKRIDVQVVQSPDGNALDYEVTDEEQPCNIVPDNRWPGITRIEATHKRSITGTGWQGAIGNVIGNIIGGAKQSGEIGALFGASKGGEIVTSAARQASRFAPVGAIAGGVVGLGDSLPLKVDMVTVSVWGDRTSTKAGLTAAALFLASSRINTDGVNASTTAVGVSHDLVNKRVTVEMMKHAGLGSRIGVLFSDLTTSANIANDFPNDSIAGILNAGDQAGLAPSKSKGTRSASYLKELVTAVLSDGDTQDPFVPATGIPGPPYQHPP
jgi:hypothetical protein